MSKLQVYVDEEGIGILQRVCDETGGYFRTPEELLEHFARAIIDGVRRPGSWERGWLTQITGWPGPTSQDIGPGVASP